MEKFSVNYCRENEIPELMQFIEIYWMKGHVFSKNNELLQWQHKDERNAFLNFVIAKELRSNQIIGIMGFLHNSIYDKSIKPEESFIWGCIWKVREDYLGYGMGKKVFEKMRTYINAPYGAFGINKEIAKLYTKMGLELGMLNQYYIINNNIHNFSLVKTNDSTKQNMLSKPNIIGKKLYEVDLLGSQEEINELFPKEVFPRKTAIYFVNRYLRHPFYKYHVYGVFDNSKMIAVFVTRFCVAHNSKAMRIVDYIGSEESIRFIGGILKQLIIKNSAEYCDFINYGINENVFLESGFKLVTYDDGSSIIPTYYEPFIQKNIMSEFACQVVKDKRRWLFKGDSDQDRPNI